ncbi:MAG: phosphatase PAP2 family protein [Sphingomonadaceae bacterium]
MVGLGRKAALLALVLAGCAAAQPGVSNAEMTREEMAEAYRALMAKGYMGRDEIPDSLAINPPPPPEGSAAEARDSEAQAAAVALQDKPRFRLAAVDAAMFNPDGSSIFSCTAGMRIAADTTPKLDALLKQTLPSLGMSTSPTKDKYMRARPFMVNGKPTCTPGQETMLRGNGSYPSGHSAIGYGWGLIMAQVMPEKAAELVARGREFGESRRICNVHWLSDVEEGRHVAAAVVAKLQSIPRFQEDVAAARAEIAAFGDEKPAPDCALEQAAFAGN